MSRVDEALRRAAAEAARSGSHQASGSVAEAPRIGVDPADFANEPFPLEVAERSSPAPVPAAAVSPPVEAKPVPRVVVSPTPPVPPALFERLDARLGSKVVVDKDMRPVSREQYRRLAATLHQTQATTGLKVVMIASAAAGEGKSLTAANLALTLSESYRRSVLLIDGDLRRPSLHTIFRTEASPGLSEGLMVAHEQKLPIHQISSRLALLPAGAPNADPMAGLTSSRMRRVIDEAKEKFDWVIIDTPPVGLLPDASLLAGMVDAAVLVVGAGSTPYELVRRAVETIGSERLLGVVLNRVTTPTQGYGAGYDYGYGYGHAESTISSATDEPA